jgi:hypothetical protein
MNLKSNEYIQTFLAAAPAGQAYNDAVAYGVTIEPAQVADGQLYWRVIGVHHLLPPENEGNHTILVEALDESGNRIRQGNGFAASQWHGQTGDPDVKALDKASYDPMGCDFPMGKEATYAVWMRGDTREAKDPTDRVDQLHTRHKDEGPDNTIGHHSFFVVFQRSRKGPNVLERDALLQTARTLRAEQIAGPSRLSAYARDRQLGAPVTAEFSAGGYRARGFERGVVCAPLAQLDDLAHVSW